MELRQLEYQLVVCGGGIPGICAAVTAARAGVRVSLVEQRPILGGNSSSFALVPPHGAASMWHNRTAREGGILEELLMEYAIRSPVADNRRIWDLILREWCEREPLLSLYLNTRVDGCEMLNHRIMSIDITQHSTETQYRLSAPLFVDGTGDGFLADAAGADYRIGREGRDEFGESLAPPEGDNKTLPCALYVVAHRRDKPVAFSPPEWATTHDNCDAFPHRPHVVDKFSKSKALNEDGSSIQLFWWFSLGGDRNTIKDSEGIFQDLVKEAFGIWDHLKNRCTPETRESLECYEAVWWSPFPLRRESRRVMGDHILTEADIFEARLFDDRVSHGGWPVDVHPPEGIYSNEPPCDQTFVNELYSVPFRSICVQKQPGVFWSYSRQEAFGTRFAARFHGELVPRPSHGKARIAPVTDDWFPLNHHGRLPLELHDWMAATVGIDFDRKVRAMLCHRVSPSTSPYHAGNVIGGSSRAEDWPNIWISDENQPLPQKISLSWPEVQKVQEISLAFDTDLDAPDRCYGWPREQHRFVFPVPQCVKDYRVLGRIGEKQMELLEVRDNYNRRRVHKLDEPVEFEELSVEVLATHGSDSARVYEIRAY